MKKSDAAARDSEPFLVIAETRPAKRRFRRRWLVVALLLALLAGGVLAAQFGLLPGRIKTTAAVAKLASDTLQAVQGNSADEADGNIAGLALQGISLFNGEKGAELWRLKASWAHLSQEGDTILVDAPVVRYTLGEPADNDYLDVKSEKGTITDSQRYLTLTGNVDVQHFGDTLTGPKLSYDSKTRVMVFPDGATLQSERATGKADVFTWDLSSSTMMGEGNVDVLIKPRTDSVPLESALPNPAVPEPTGADATPAVISPAATSPAITAPTAAKPKAVTSQTPTAPSTKATSAKVATPTKKTATKKTVTKTSTKKAATQKTGRTPAATKTTAPKKAAPKKSTPKQSATPAKSTS